MIRRISLFLLLLSFLGCTQGGVDNGSVRVITDIDRTLTYLETSALPETDELFADLPDGLLKLSQLEYDTNSGEAAAADNLSNVALTSTETDMTQLTNDSREMIAQGISEMLRLQQQLRNHYSQLVKTLDFKKGFSQFSTAGLKTSANDTHLLHSLRSKEAFSIQLGDNNSFANAFRVSEVGQYIQIEALKKAGSEYSTSAIAQIRIPNSEDIEIKFYVKTAAAASIIGNWAASPCAEDLYFVHYQKTSSTTQVDLRSLECPTEKNRINHLRISNSSEGTNYSAAFSQNFSASSNTLREFLGPRQSYILHASKSSEFLAAALAVIPTDEGQTATAQQIQQFSLAGLITNYIVSRLWTPQYQQTTAQPATAYLDNIAYWMCNAPVVSPAAKSSSSDISSLCSGTSVSQDLLLNALQDLLDSGGSLIPAGIKTAIEDLVNVLRVKNNFYFNGASFANYGTSPGTNYDVVTSRLSEVTHVPMASHSWREDVTFSTYSSLTNIEWSHIKQELEDQWTNYCTQEREKIANETGVNLNDSACRAISF